MNDSTQPNRPQPKLVTKRDYLIMLVSVLIGASLGILREYLSTGSVTGTTLGSSIAGFIIGLIMIIIIVMGHYANKPEK